VLGLYVCTYSHNVIDTIGDAVTLRDDFTVSKDQELGIYVVFVAIMAPTPLRLDILIMSTYQTTVDERASREGTR